MMKRCPRCQQKLPATSEFWGRRKKNKNGLYDYCRDCVREINRERYDPEWYRAWDERNRDKHREQERERMKDPERRRKRREYLKNYRKRLRNRNRTPGPKRAGRERK